MEQGLTALIIDDDRGDRMQFRRLLRDCGHPLQVQEAEDLGALNAHGDRSFDVIFLDNLLPGQTGLDALEDVRRTWPDAAVILITGQGDEAIAKTSIQRGATDYIPKSNATAPALTRMIERGVEKVRLLREIEAHRQELETFSDVLVHDIKAPIRAVTFLSEQIGESLEGRDVDQAAEFNLLLDRSIHQMSDLVQSLASHLRLQRGMAPHHPVPIHDIVGTAVTALAVDIGESGAEIETMVEPFTLSCDPAQMAQLLQNLLGNAMKYSAPDTPRITLTAQVEEGAARISIADLGIGVPPEQASRVFEPFRRLSNGADQPGTGLGLATCQKIVERHGGRIWCAPNTPRGTVFHVTLPLAEEAEDAPITNTRLLH